jgi:VWFA-related protein
MMNKTLIKITVIALLFSMVMFSAWPVLADATNDLVINYIESQPLEEKLGYDVSVLFSFIDASGNPIKDVELENLTLSEDGKGVSPVSLGLTTDQPIYISLLLDTSGSMRGSKNTALITASTEFVNRLNEKDRISITTFNNEIKNLINFSTDHKAATSLVSSIEAVPGTGTCLYDAAYEAVQNIAALPMGRRAVIILTDGKDESPQGGACSKLTIDDVIRLASQGNTRVPIFSIGIGDSVDEAGLARIAKLTGGIYSKTPTADQLTTSFTRLLDLLQSQYILHYTSVAAPGNHTLVVNVDYLKTLHTDSREFMLFELPIRLSIISPVAGQKIDDKILIATSITGKAEPIKQVNFLANDTVLGIDETTPYELEWQPDAKLNGNVTISVVAIGKNNNELAKDEVQVIVAATNALTGSAENNLIPTDGLWANYYLYGGILAALLAVAVIVLITLKSRKGKKEKQRDKLWHDMVVSPPSTKNQMNEMTMDGFVLSANALGALTVLQSDDPAMIGQRFEITEDATRLGRAADNEILFPKDSPVSRHHAIIENRNGQLTLSEMVSAGGDGSVKSPTFGTYINDVRLTRPTVLQNGDQIKLGKRVLLRFESSRPGMEGDDAKTQDQITFKDTDKTMDSM